MEVEGLIANAAIVNNEIAATRTGAAELFDRTPSMCLTRVGDDAERRIDDALAPLVVEGVLELLFRGRSWVLVRR